MAALEDNILQMYAEHYGTQSEKYQEEADKRAQISEQEKQQEAEINTAWAREATTVASLDNEINKLQSTMSRLQQGSAASSKKSFSIASMLGIDDTGESQLKKTLEDLTSTYQTAMAQIATAERTATNPKEFEDALMQEDEATKRFQKDVLAAQVQSAQQTQQAWTQSLNSIESKINSSLANSITGGKGFGNAMRSIAKDVENYFIEMGLKAAESWLNSLILQQVQTATTAATNAATTAATATGGVLSNAAVAAAAAYASTAAIPIVGPELAPAAAAAAYADAASWTGAIAATPLSEGAWEIPGTMHAILHEGESVVPQRFAEGLRTSGSLADAAGSTTNNLHYSPNVNAPHADLSELLRSQGNTMLSWLNNQIKNRHLMPSMGRR